MRTRTEGYQARADSRDDQFGKNIGCGRILIVSAETKCYPWILMQTKGLTPLSDDAEFAEVRDIKAVDLVPAGSKYNCPVKIWGRCGGYSDCSPTTNIDADLVVGNPQGEDVI